MKLTTRFLLIGLGILIFAVAAPIIILYARGFKYDWATRQIVKTGALVVHTDPTGAQVFLNNQLEKGKTPLNIRFLIPDDYTVRIEKDGYQPWTKRLTVRSQLVTWANDNRESLTLFLNQPKLINTYPGSQISLSDDRDDIYFTDAQGQLKTLDVNSGRVAAASPPAASRAYLSGSDLYLTQNDRPALIASNVLAFNLLDNDLWYIQNQQLIRDNLSTNQTSITLPDLPAAAAATIIRPPDQLYLILDSTLYAVNDSLQKIYSPVTNAVWDQASSQLLYGNASEIEIYNPKTQDSTLIQRTLTPIAEAVINTPSGYVFFANDGKIKAAEIDGRDQRNIYTIADMGSNFVLSDDGTTLFVITANAISQYTIR